MVNCLVKNCSSRSIKNSNEKLSFYVIPKVILNQCQRTKALSEKRRSSWLKIIQRPDLLMHSGRYLNKVCSKHFITGSPAALMDENSPDWVPTLNLSNLTPSSKSKLLSSAQRHKRAIDRSRQKLMPHHSSGVRNISQGSETSSINVIETDNQNGIEFQETMDSSLDDYILPKVWPVIQEDSSDILNEIAESVNLKSAYHMIQEDKSDQVISIPKHFSSISCEVKPNVREISTQTDNSFEPQTFKNVKHSESQTNSENTRSSINSSSQSDLTCSLISSLEQECLRLQTQVYDLKDQVNVNILNDEYFTSNEKRLVYYTGLPNLEVVMATFNLLKTAFELNLNTKLTKFQQFIIILMHLRLNLDTKDLGYRFNVSCSTISRILDKWLEIMYKKLKRNILWPEREQLQKTMPYCFQLAFGDNVAVIIDCFEIFIERPSSNEAKAHTWSNYKHHNTVKFLIGISPQGVITFISKAWGRRVSDKHITDHCGILEKLLPGDLVLADRGFTIETSVGFYCAKLAIPAFTRGKKQLSPQEVMETRKIANVRIHVERAIGLTRNKYTILKSVLPVDYMITNGNDIPKIDKLVSVCCALVNSCNSVVPFE